MRRKNYSITIITAIYNTESFLRETVESVASQTILPDEHILVDDCSTDGSLALARQLEREYPHVRVIQHETNRGYPTALNTGIATSKSEYIGILDSDDIALPNWLETVMPVMHSNSQIGAVGGGGIIMTKNGETTGCVVFGEFVGDVTDKVLSGGYPILHPGTVFRKSSVLSVGGYNELMKSAEDNDMFMSISSFSKIFSVGVPLIYYRRLPVSESRKNPEYEAALSEIQRAKLNLLRSGLNVSEANDQIASKLRSLKNIPRLSSRNDDSYAYEIAYAFAEGGMRYRSLIEYAKLLITMKSPLRAFRGIVKCLFPAAFVNIYRRIRYFLPRLRID